MISASLVVEGHNHGLGPGHGGPHHPHHNVHMTFGEPFLLPGPNKGGGEFLRPLPKPAPLVPRYNGASAASLNGCRVVPTQPGPRVSSSATSGAVNLVQHKEENGADDPPPSPSFPAPQGYNSRLYPPPHPSYYPGLQGPYGSLYPGHYTPLMARAGYAPPPPPSPLDTYRHSPPQPQPAPTAPAAAAAAAAFLAAQSAYSPPCSTAQSTQHVKPGQSLLLSHRRPFKVPSGKEGSLKHRILTRPSAEPKRRALPANFTKGSLIQLANGDLRRVEDMRTEDFVTSAEQSAAVRLDPSTVVRIEHSPGHGSAMLTLSYGENRTQVEYEASLEHPFFVYGQGWASCAPDRTLQCYGLKCHRLQVGDICISLTPRPSMSNSSPARPPRNCVQQNKDIDTNNRTPQNPRISVDQSSPGTGHPRKRRWSAPDHFLKEEEEGAVHLPGTPIRRIRE